MVQWRAAALVLLITVAPLFLPLSLSRSVHPSRPPFIRQRFSRSVHLSSDAFILRSLALFIRPALLSSVSASAAQSIRLQMHSFLTHRRASSPLSLPSSNSSCPLANQFQYGRLTDSTSSPWKG